MSTNERAMFLPCVLAPFLEAELVRARVAAPRNAEVIDHRLPSARSLIEAVRCLDERIAALAPAHMRNTTKASATVSHTGSAHCRT